MANAINTGSTLTTNEGLNKTSTSISTNIIIMVQNKAVGAVQSLQVQERRSIKMIDEVGTDGHIDSVPYQSTNITGTCQRVRFDRLRIAEAFSRGFIHVASQVYPFDIVIIDRQKRDSASQISTVIKNVWISGIEYTYQASDWVITDTMNWEAENIWSILNGGSSPLPGGVPVAQGGEIGVTRMGVGAGGIQTWASAIEQAVDTGSCGRRGSLDASGIIDIGSSGDLF
jgi:hypothetical protein